MGTTRRGGRPEPKGGNVGEMQHPKKKCTMCGQAQNGKYRQGTHVCFGCGKSGQMVRGCPQNRGQAVANSQPRTNPHGAAATETPRRNRFYALRGQR